MRQPVVPYGEGNYFSKDTTNEIFSFYVIRVLHVLHNVHVVRGAATAAAAAIPTGWGSVLGLFFFVTRVRGVCVCVCLLMTLIPS